eukprot:4673682-Amphidinium_carterae.1
MGELLGRARSIETGATKIDGLVVQHAVAYLWVHNDETVLEEHNRIFLQCVHIPVPNAITAKAANC